ncbi:MAG: alpha/beta hydrolase [Oscillospiraceae bacterium]|jgi:fermentation-respiration switch protein FrsA (DUF1100 family)
MSEKEKESGALVESESAQKKSNTGKYLLYAGLAAAGAAAVVTAADVIICRSLCRRSGISSLIRKAGMREKTERKEGSEIREEAEKRKQALMASGQVFRVQKPLMRTNIRSFDGTSLAGFYREDTSNHRWMLGFHGYNSDHEVLIDNAVAPYFDSLGYNILLPDMRANGESGGKYTGAGWLEGMDVVYWVRWVVGRDPDAEIVLFGQSLGAASVLMAGGSRRPCMKRVKAIIEDSGYASVWTMFKDCTEDILHMPKFPFIYVADIYSRIHLGFSARKADIGKRVTASSFPTLFIHGEDDRVVDPINVRTLYDCKVEGYKEMRSVPCAGHVSSVYVLGDEYYGMISSFLKRAEEYRS